MRSFFRSLHRTSLALFGGLGLALTAQPAAAQGTPVSLLDSVPIGGGGLCEAQIRPPQAGDGLFDRRYLVICRDASAPVGSLAVLANASEDGLLAEARRGGAECVRRDDAMAPQGLPAVTSYACTSSASGLQTTLIFGRRGSQSYLASGVTAYRDALDLGLASLASDRIVEGTIAIPLTQASDAAAFARAQAEAISAENALVEAYRRANAGAFAEAAEFFTTSAEALTGQGAIEAQLNLALQQSNLGNYVEAALAFIAAREAIGEHPVLTRMARNFEALDALNRSAPAEALQTLDTPLQGSATGLDALRQLEVSQPLADRLAAEQGNALSGVSGDLTVLERAALLDGQANYVRASALRALGRREEARASLVTAQSQLLAVREGRIASIMWLRAQVLAELAELDERAGNRGSAESLHREAVALIESNYPGSPALVTAQAQLAGFLARNGREAEALGLFQAVVADGDSKPGAVLRRLLAPYFELLASRADQPDTAERMFAASQLLLRPGLAQTQAVLARELSGGSDEAAQLFRRSINVGRAIEQLRSQIAQAEVTADPADAAGAERIASMRTQLSEVQAQQLQLQQELGAYPRYRVVSDDQMDLAVLQQLLRPGEAYFKLVMLDDAAFGIYVENGFASAYQVDAPSDTISQMVDTLRDSIAIDMAGQTITYPFDMATSRQLYLALFGPVDARLRATSHLVFEPDGALLRLPANLLVTDDASVERYEARVAADENATYDFRGTRWLGRDVQISTAVSPTSFRDVRNARASNAQNEYLGMGQNLPLGEGGFPTGTRGGVGGAGERCDWSPAVWNNPITAGELRTANQIVAAGGGQGRVLTDAQFSDSALLGMAELNEYRILHFATHGLVTAPQPHCPPKPALLTSFGSGESDGLLSFAEIFDLTLDADLVILSACNTASAGGLVASREAGISGTGNFALDGLVRAFVGAGSRTVVASHWPVPDDYDATQRLISGFFSGSAGVPTTEALRQAQLRLMEDPDTSHPFYWSAFAVVGDGAIALRR